MRQQKKPYVLSSIAGLIIGALTVSPGVLADTSSSAVNKAMKATKPAVSIEQDQANKKAIQDHAKTQHDLLKEVDKGISEGFHKVLEAAKLIKENKPKEAIKALQEATGKFDIALAANPNLGLIPIAASVKVSELITTPELVKAQVSQVKELLDDSKVQAAKIAIAPLQDDMVTQTTLLPMTTYPDAIKLATKMLVENKKEAALATLSTALSTFVHEVSVTPLSLLRVETMIGAASELDKEKNKDQALKLISAAEDQLKIATLLGYTDKDSDLYENLATQLKGLKKEISGGNVVGRLYKDLKTSIKELLEKKPEKSKQ